MNVGFQMATTASLLAGTEEANVGLKLLRLKQTQTDQETSHIINHTQPMRGESGQNYLYKIFCFLRSAPLRNFCLLY